LPKNYYAGRRLTSKLGLAYKSIHACEKSFVLFRGELQGATNCPKCHRPRHRDHIRKKFRVKVLRHFSIIPRLQRMFYSPTLSKLLLWHSENGSNCSKGDNLVQHPCDSKAWHHFYKNVDPNFGQDARNVHFALVADVVNLIQ